MKIRVLSLDHKVEFPGARAGEIQRDYFTAEDYDIEKCVDGFLINKKNDQQVLWVPHAGTRYAELQPVLATLSVVKPIKAQKSK
jgi:hypothetical protein